MKRGRQVRRRGRSWIVEDKDPSGWTDMSGAEAAGFVTPPRTAGGYVRGVVAGVANGVDAARRVRLGRPFGRRAARA